MLSHFAPFCTYPDCRSSHTWTEGLESALMAGRKEVIPEADRWILITSCCGMFRNAQTIDDARGSRTSLKQSFHAN